MMEKKMETNEGYWHSIHVSVMFMGQAVILNPKPLNPKP